MKNYARPIAIIQFDVKSSKKKSKKARAKQNQKRADKFAKEMHAHLIEDYIPLFFDKIKSVKIKVIK